MQGIFEDGVEKIVTPRGNIAVVDNLVSTSGLDALSDKQGNILAKDIASYVLSGDKPESTLTTGTFFVDKTGALRVAKSDISISTDVSNSNSEVKSVGEVLKTLNASLTQSDYVEVVADGVKTYRQLLYQLGGLLQHNRISPRTRLLEIVPSEYSNYSYTRGVSNNATVTSFFCVDSRAHMRFFLVNINDPAHSLAYDYNFYNNAFTDKSDNVVTSGNTLRVLY